MHTIEEKVEKILIDYSWPGNVRELENVVEFMINLSDERGTITVDMLPDNIVQESLLNIDGTDPFKEKDSETVITLADAEKLLIEKAINRCGNDTKGKKEAAKRLGIGIATLYRKIEKYSLE